MKEEKNDTNWLETLTIQNLFGPIKKPLEIYLFLDPICAECWGLEPILKRLTLEYNRYFSLKHVLSGTLASLNINKRSKMEDIADIWEKTASRSGMSCDGTLWLDNPILSPYKTSIGIKAAELQGKKAGDRFLRKIQEVLFLEKQNVDDLNVLIECAKAVHLDVEEFIKDISSESAAKAFQYDLKITSEMEVDEIPTMVFFNQNIEEEGLKVSGIYPYEVYVQILTDILGFVPEPAKPPALEKFIKHYNVVASREVSEVYNLEPAEVEREMKKLVLKRLVEKVPVKHGTIWKYIGD